MNSKFNKRLKFVVLVCCEDTEDWQPDKGVGVYHGWLYVDPLHMTTQHYLTQSKSPGKAPLPQLTFLQPHG